MVREREIIIQTKFTKNKIQKARFVLPAAELVSTPALSASLGQLQLNTNDVIRQFNLKTENFTPGILINLILHKRIDGSFILELKNFFLPFLFFQACYSLNDFPRAIYVENLFDVFLIYNGFDLNNLDDFAEEELENKAKQFFGALRSTKFNIQF